MSRVRVLMAEIDGSDEAVRDAVTSFPSRSEGSAPLRAVAASDFLPELSAHALPGLAAVQKPRRGRPPGKRSAKPAKLGKRAASPAKTGDSGALSPCAQKLIELLRKGPRTSVDLVTESGYKNPSVYTTLAALRNSGIVKTEAIGDDPRPVNRLVKG
jgi:hypothetical protein